MHESIVDEAYLVRRHHVRCMYEFFPDKIAPIVAPASVRVLSIRDLVICHAPGTIIISYW